MSLRSFTGLDDRGTGRKEDTVNGLLVELRHALRMLGRRPAFTLVVVATLALGIGVNTAVFSVVRGVLLRPLPYAEPGRLLSIVYHSQGRTTHSLSQPELLDFRTMIPGFEAVAAYTFRRPHLGTSEEPRQIRVVEATHELLPLLGVPLAAGRGFSAAETLPDAPSVVVLGHRLREQLFPGRVDVLGAEVVLGGVPHTVIGVTRPGFAFPEPTVAAYRPFRLDPANPDQRNNHNLRVVARVHPGVSLDAARAQMAEYGRWAVAQYPAYYSGFAASFDAEPLREIYVGATRTPLLLALGAVNLVLLIACANVASLLLARGEERRRELAVRLALGCSARRLGRQLLVETSVLALVGALAAVPLAGLAQQGILALGGAQLPLQEAVWVDGVVLAYTLGMALAASLLAGLVPVLRARRAAPREDLQGGTRAVLGQRRHLNGRRLLVAGQVGLAVALAVGASLLTRTIGALAATDVGFVTSGSVAALVSLPPHLYQKPDEIVALVRALEDGARGLPGVEAAGVVESLPLAFAGANNLSLQVEGRVVETVGEAPTALVQGISPAGLGALGLRVREGRAFTAQDVAEGRKVALVNQAFVRKHLAGLDRGTSRVRMFASGRPWLEIVGVVEDFRQDGVVVERDWPQLIVPFELSHQNAYRISSMFFLVAHGHAAPESLAGPLRELIRAAAPAAVIRDVRTLERVKRDAEGGRAMLATLLRSAAGLALALAGLGVYGVVALWVGQRRQEIGLRMALGASRLSVLRLVLVQAGGPVLLGLGAGLGLAFALAVALRSLLHGVTPADPLSMLAVTAALAVTAGLAAAAPARRAAHVEPSTALRAE